MALRLAFAFSFLVGYVGREAYVQPPGPDSLRLALVSAVFGTCAILALLMWDTRIKVVRS